MPITRAPRLAFNRGLISRLGLARADIQRTALASETHTNWVPRVLGSMSPRPGTQYIATTYGSQPSRNLAFVFSTNDVARIELTDFKMRVFINDVLINRPGVSTSVTNPHFDANLNSWTDNDEAGGVSVWVAGGYMGLTGNGTAAAIRDQAVTIAVPDVGVEHALLIVIKRGPVVFSVGSALGGDQYIRETTLDTGTHSLAFTPTGATVYIRFSSRLLRQVLVDDCVLENFGSAGDMSVSTPWATADLDAIAVSNDSQYAQQSGDIIFIGCNGLQQYAIERRGVRSWSVVRYQSNDGPFRFPNVSSITLAPTALFGNTALNASSPFFRTTHAPSTYNDGALFRIISTGQDVAANITAQNQFTNAILVEGVDTARLITVFIDEDAAGAAVFTLQRSVGSATGPWTNVEQWTADVLTTRNDGLNNQQVYYRLGVAVGDYVNGTHQVQLSYAFGSSTGICRVTSYISSIAVNVEVIKDFGSGQATTDWSEGEWSDYRGWPTAGAFCEGRLAWAGRNGIFMSVSDGFYSFDDQVVGDSAPIARTIGSGPVDVINWMLPLQRLILGAQCAEYSVRASSLDEVLTVTNFNIKAASTQGSSPVPALKVDNQGIFVGKGGSRVFELEYQAYAIDYTSTEITAIVPDVCKPRIVRMAVQRSPDTRAHFVLSDGTVAMLIYDKVEKVLCWMKIESPGAHGLIEDVCILPANTTTAEDSVYYQTVRTVNGVTVRYHEKLALDADCRPASDGSLQICKMADAFITYTQSANATITGLGHLEGQAVVVWDNGVCLNDSDGNIATFTVLAGKITVTHNGAARLATIGMVGLQYESRWKGARLSELMKSEDGSLVDSQSIRGLGLILADVHAKGLRFGSSFDDAKLNDLPSISSEDGGPIDPDEITVAREIEEVTFPGGYSHNTRLCLLAQSPRPCTVLAAIAKVDQHG